MKVLSYNILNGGGWRLRRLAAIIRSEEPDVVALLEANRRWLAVLLARMLGMQLIFGQAHTNFHVAWLSRLPVLRSTNHRLPGLAKTLLEIEVDWGGQPVGLFATHLAGGADIVHPAEEVPLLLEVLRARAAQPHLLAGDLNALHPDDAAGRPPPGWSMLSESADDDPRRAIGALLEAGYTDCFRARHLEAPGYTYPAEQPWLRLDYIFASPSLALRLTASGAIDGDDVRRASDHLPVWALFK